MPQVVNPKKGYIVGCNQQVVPLNYKHLVGTAIPTTGRSYRANELLHDVTTKKQRVDLEFMKTMQLDVHSAYGREIAKLLIPFVDRYSSQFLTKDDLTAFNHMLDIVKAWNFEYTHESKGALVFNMWYYEIMDGLLQRQIKEKWTRNSVVKASSSMQFLGILLKKYIDL